MVKEPNKHIYNAVVVVWLTLSLGSVLLAAATWSQLSRLVTTGRQESGVRENLAQILKLLLDAETGARGYVITGDKRFLEPLAGAETNLPAAFDALAQAAPEAGEMLDQFADLHAQAEMCLHWQYKLTAARDRSFGKAAELMTSGEGKTLMDGIREQMAALDKILQDRRAKLRGEVGAQLFRASLTSWWAGVLAIGVGAYAFRLSRLTLKHQKRERELMEENLRAEHSNREKNVFLANMSHEIRTPMNAILGFSELLLDDLREPRQRQYLQSIRTSANSLLLLINDILDVSKIEAGVMSLRLEPTDPREISDLIRTLFAEPAAKKGIRLECQVAPDLPRSLLVDRIRLRQVLVNLVGNAIKFTDVGMVETRVNWIKSPHGGHLTLVIEVQDSGMGIPPDKLADIFQPFTQVGNQREKENQGTGLGLAIVKRLVELMGGTVTVASVLGRGSVFHLHFPDVAISARLASPEKNQTRSGVDFNELNPATLIVVDDHELNRQLIAGMFAGTHHRLVFAAGGEEALTQARRLKPDLILMDLRLPGMSGQETLAEIRKINGLELMPVLAVSASVLTETESAEKERFSGYLRKPFTKRELFEELAGFLPARPGGEIVREPAVPGAWPENTEPVPRELLAQLREQLIHPWPALRDSVAVNDSRAFARRLESLGRHWQCPALIGYAETLLNDVENYAVADLETHLGQFAALVEQLVRNPRNEP
jgi:signal transduction histidine kinase/CheY-like chemotaxis protein